MKFYKLLLIFPIFYISGCATLFPSSLEKDHKIEWKKDLLMSINDKMYHGIALVPKARLYNIKIFPPVKTIDRIQWGSCHGGDNADKAVEYGLWPWSKKQKYFSMTYTPKNIELDRACPLKITALAQKHKAMAFGMIIVPDVKPHISLKATLECNRKTQLKKVGTTACQAAIKSIHRIHFDGEVFQDARENIKCPPFKKVKPNVFEFFMPRDLCVYLFKSRQKAINGKFKTHKLITYGYEKVPPPKEL